MPMLSRDSTNQEALAAQMYAKRGKRLDFHAFGRLEFCGVGTRTAGKTQFFDSLIQTMKGGGKMADAQQINDFLVDAFGRINKIEERAMTTGLGSAISITEIHIIEKIGLSEPARMSEIAHMLGVTLATMTVACDKLEGKGLVRRARSRSDRRVVQVTLTPRGRAVYEYHRAFHERMISSILDTLSPEQSTVLAQSLEKLQDFFLREEAAAEGENNG